MKFEIKNRWTCDVQYSCDISAEVAEKSYGMQLGSAIKSAVSSGADLRGAVLRVAVLSGADLSDADLSDADLSDADLSRADLSDADLSGADLSGADLSGADLRGADLSDADLSGADLRGADLRDADLRGAGLRDAGLRDADLSDADLSDADLSGADLSGADLRDADLRGAGLRGAGLPRCPVVINNIHSAVYAAASQPMALDMGDWHTCDTTHCRAGWVVMLAGDGGRALEYAYGTPTAAALIYISSDPHLERIPDFYCGNDEALEDMRRLAEAEAAA